MGRPELVQKARTFGPGFPAILFLASRNPSSRPLPLVAAVFRRPFVPDAVHAGAAGHVRLLRPAEAALEAAVRGDPIFRRRSRPASPVRPLPYQSLRPKVHRRDQYREPSSAGVAAAVGGQGHPSRLPCPVAEAAVALLGHPVADPSGERRLQRASMWQRLPVPKSVRCAGFSCSLLQVPSRVVNASCRALSTRIPKLFLDSKTRPRRAVWAAVRDGLRDVRRA